MTSVYAYHNIMCLVLFLPVQSLLTCFRSFLNHFADLSLITLPRTVRLFYVSLCCQAPQQQCIVHCMHYGITLWAYLSETLVKDNHKHLSSTEKSQYRVLKSLDHTLLLRTCYGEIYGNIAREEKG